MRAIRSRLDWKYPIVSDHVPNESVQTNSCTQRATVADGCCNGCHLSEKNCIVNCLPMVQIGRQCTKIYRIEMLSTKNVIGIILLIAGALLVSSMRWLQPLSVTIVGVVFLVLGLYLALQKRQSGRISDESSRWTNDGDDV